MSRNLRQTNPVTPTKTPSKRSSKTIDVSSDDDYAGVEEITDSEEEEPDVEEAEEQAIIESEEDSDATPRPSKPDAQYIDDDNDDEEEDDDIDPDDLDENGKIRWTGFGAESDIEYPENPHFNDHIARTLPYASHDSSFDYSPAFERRVRFASVGSSDDGSETSDDEYWPDLFVARDDMDPHFLRIIEQDGDGESDNDSYWELNNSDDNPVQLEGFENSGDDLFPQPQDESSGEGNSSGYETDEGSTTEEDLPDEAKLITPRSVHHQEDIDSIERDPDEEEPQLAKALPKSKTASNEEESSDEEEVQRRPPRRRIGPKLGQWFSRPTTNYALHDTKTKRVIMFRVKPRNARAMDDLGFTSLIPLSQGTDISDTTGLTQDLTPVMKSQMNVLMPGMQSSNVLNAGHIMGPPEAFMPFVGINPDGTLSYDDLTDGSAEREEWEMGYDADTMDITDFINFAEDDSDDEEEVEEVEQSSDSPATIAEPSSTPARPTNLRSEDQVHHLLNHFDNGLVGAFRQNQTRHQLLARHEETHDSLSFHNPHGVGPIRGIKQGRLPNANNPITPLRKRKPRHMNTSIDSSPLSHLTAGGLQDQRKRKMEMGESSRGHKRTKSLA